MTRDVCTVWEMMKRKQDCPDDQMHEFRDEPSESSSDEDFEAALSREGM